MKKSEATCLRSVESDPCLSSVTRNKSSSFSGYPYLKRTVFDKAKYFFSKKNIFRSKGRNYKSLESLRVALESEKECLIDSVNSEEDLTDVGLAVSVNGRPASHFNRVTVSKDKQSDCESKQEENLHKIFKVNLDSKHFVSGAKANLEDPIAVKIQSSSENVELKKQKNAVKYGKDRDKCLKSEVNSLNPGATSCGNFRLPAAVRKLTEFFVATNKLDEGVSEGLNRLDVAASVQNLRSERSFKKPVCRTEKLRVGKVNGCHGTNLNETKLGTEDKITLYKNGVGEPVKQVIPETPGKRSKQLIPPKTIKLHIDEPILDYTYTAADHFFSTLESVHDYMDLVRNGIQQLVDHFTHPQPLRLQDQENIVLEFRHSIKMLQHTIERVNYSVYNLPKRVAHAKCLLLPCSNTIVEFNKHLQLISIELEHTQYFNNDSPMLTMLKMIVIIQTLYAVIVKGRKAFLKAVQSSYTKVSDHRRGYDLSQEHEGLIRPAHNMLFRRTQAMVELCGMCQTLFDMWQQVGSWEEFLPGLRLFIGTVRSIEPHFAVPDQWFVMRILPETRLMHVFDGFMSEFYRAIVTPDFANANPTAFGAIFTVLQYILDNVIQQHVIILRDLRNMLKLPVHVTEPVQENALEQQERRMASVSNCGNGGGRYVNVAESSENVTPSGTCHDYANFQSDINKNECVYVTSYQTS